MRQILFADRPAKIDVWESLLFEAPQFTVVQDAEHANSQWAGNIDPRHDPRYLRPCLEDYLIKYLGRKQSDRFRLPRQPRQSTESQQTAAVGN